MVGIWREKLRFLDSYPHIQTLIKKIPMVLWTGIFSTLNYITLRFELYQT